MLMTNTSCFRDAAAAFSGASHCLAVVLCTFPPGSDGVGNARVRCAVPKGTMLDTDKVAKDLRGVAGWISAGQLHCVLAAQATSFYSIGAAIAFQTLP